MQILKNPNLEAPKAEGVVVALNRGPTAPAYRGLAWERLSRSPKDIPAFFLHTSPESILVVFALEMLKNPL